MGMDQIEKLLHNKGNNYQNQETTYRMGEKYMPAIHWVID
jgi:hypothetical protein